MEHIQFVLNCMEKNTTKVTNMRAMLITALYNSVNTISSYYSSLYNYHRSYGVLEKGEEEQNEREKRTGRQMQENRFWCSACHINCLFWRFFRKVVSFSCSTKPVCMHLERLYNSNRTSKFRSSIFMYAAFGYAHYLERKGKGYFRNR